MGLWFKNWVYPAHSLIFFKYKSSANKFIQCGYKCFKYFCSMKYLLFILVPIAVTVCCSGCHSNQQKAATTTQPVKDTGTYFPIKEILTEEINDVNSTPYFMYKIETNNAGKKDSSVIYAKEFEHLAQPFLDADINSPALKPLLNESVFHDLSTNSYSFTYAPAAQDDTFPIKSVIILLNDANNKLKNIFIHKILHRADTTIDEALHWKPTNYFTINKEYLLKDSVINKNKIFVNWKH